MLFRSREARKVAPDLLGRAATTPCAIPVVAAGAGIRRRYKGKRRRETQVVFSTGNRYPTIFEGLAQALEDVSLELRQFIEEEHAVMSQGYLAGKDVGASSQHSGVRDRLVGSPEGPQGNDSPVFSQKVAAYGVNARGLQGLLEGHGRQNG